MNPMLELKKLVAEETDLGKPFNYFFDLVDNKIILNMHDHRPVKQMKSNGELSAVLGAVGHGVTKQLGKEIKIDNSMFFEIPQYSFFHGSCFTSSLLAPVTVLYFSTIQTGLFAMLHNGNSDLFRFMIAKKSDFEKKH